MGKWKPKKDETGGQNEANTTKQSKPTKIGAVANSTDGPRPSVRGTVVPQTWTGKFPASLLHEHCQKQGWEKVDYIVKPKGNGFISTVSLARLHPKTREREMVRMTPPEEIGIKPTAMEARHQAAVYALHRIASHKNLQHVLPPDHRDLWRMLESQRKENAKNESQKWQFDPDPFLASSLRTLSLETALAKKSEPQPPKRNNWSWLPQVDMDLHTRTMVENTIRGRSIWSKYSRRPHERLEISDLAALGFRQSHAREAIEATGSVDEALEWLLVHVPEDDLPEKFLPSDYAVGYTLSKQTTESLSLRYAAERLSKAGYPKLECERMLARYSGDEEAAAVELLKELVTFDNPTELVDEQVWADEKEALASIYRDRMEVVANGCIIKLQCAVKNYISFTVELWPAKSYPAFVPAMFISSTPMLPAYIRLRLMKRATQVIMESCQGQAMIFDIVEWLESNMGEMVADPGPLLDVAPVVTGEHVSNVQARKVVSTAVYRSGLSQKVSKSPSPIIFMESRMKLPAWSMRTEVAKLIQDSQVTVVSGETGSGKSTQVPQFILDYCHKKDTYCNIICSQPRRISAISLAERVAEERGQRVGDSIGYQIRGEMKRGKHTQIVFVTVGLLLRQLETSVSFDGVTHFIIDEVHERSLESDLALVLLKRVLRTNKNIRVILMSATINVDGFKSYFPSTGHVHISGRTYPVDIQHLDGVRKILGINLADTDDSDDKLQIVKQKSTDSARQSINYDLIARLVIYVANQKHIEGGILIFLPGKMLCEGFNNGVGVAEISLCKQALSNSSRFWVLPLHSSLPSAEQRKVFQKPPTGKQKVIIATNIAETSITIDDIIVVIDSGRVKRLQFDPANNLVQLAEEWISRAEGSQRAGRAGRVQQGICFKLYKESLEDHVMLPQTTPEILRVPLEQIYLRVKALNVDDVSTFLSQAITPPSIAAIERAKLTLLQVGALSGNNLTALGKHMASIQADVRCAKLLIYSCVFGCVEDALTVAAILSLKSPFVSPSDARDEANIATKTFDPQGCGDLICSLNAFNEWDDLKSKLRMSELRHWCTDNFLSYPTLSDIASNRLVFAASLHEIGFNFDTQPAAPKHITLMRALISASLFPNAARIVLPSKQYAKTSGGTLEQDSEARSIKYLTPCEDSTQFAEERVFLHPSSVLFSSSKLLEKSAYVSYFAKVKTSKTFIRNITPTSVCSLLLLCGCNLAIDPHGHGLTLDGIVRVRSYARIGALFRMLRKLLDQLVESRMEALNVAHSTDSNTVLDCMMILLQGEGVTLV